MESARTSRAAALRQVPLFTDLSEEELGFLAAHALAHEYRAGELIFSEGDPCQGLYVIESGTVKIFKTSGQRARASADHRGSRKFGGGIAGI